MAAKKKAKKKVTKKKLVIKRWSYSRYSMYKQCPAQYKWHYILKHPRGTSFALERGLDIHAKAENYVNGIITSMPKELLNFADEFKALKREFNKGNGFCEPDVSFNEDGTASTKFETNYFIGFLDFHHKGKVVTVIDYKTGKKYPTHRDQGHVYAMALLKLNPELEEVFVEFWYLDDKNDETNVTEFHYTRAQFPRMQSAWDKRIETMYADKKFIAKPNKFCKWCAKKKAGKCDG